MTDESSMSSDTFTPNKISPLQRFKTIFGLTKDYSKRPIGLSWRSSTLFIVATVGIGIFTDLFLYGLVVPILPYLLEDAAHVPRSEIQKHVSGLLTVYGGASFLLAPFVGYIADKSKSRQAPYLCGLSACIAATVLFFVGRSVAVLFIARILQGASSAFVWIVGLALCMDTVGPDNLGKTIGTIFSFISIGELFSPILGGFLYKRTGSMGVMILALSLLVIDLFMRLVLIEKKIAARYPADDAPDPQSADGDATSNDEEEVNEETTLLANGHKAELDEFCIPSDQPKLIRNIPVLYCFKNPSLIAAQIVTLMQAVLLASIDATVPTHAEELYDFDSLKSGLLFIPLTIVNMLCGFLAGWCVDRYGTKSVGVIGFAYLAPAFALLRIPGPAAKQVYLFGGLLGVIGAGLAFISPPGIVESGIVVDKFHKRNEEFFGENGPYGQLYAVNGMIFNLGLSVGPIAMGMLKERSVISSDLRVIDAH